MHSKPFSEMRVQLYRSQEGVCPYFPDRKERQLFAVFNPEEMKVWGDRLNRIGFRRSMNSLYMPLCSECRACRPLRVPVARFSASRNLRRVLRVNSDLRIIREPCRVSRENFALFRRYLRSRHAGSDMNMLNEAHFVQLMESVPGESFLLSAYDPGECLVASMMIDSFADGYSAVYSFFDPARHRRSLGSLLILSLLDYARSTGDEYVYLGYYVEGISNMSYKRRFRPLEVFDWQRMVWCDFADSAEKTGGA